MTAGDLDVGTATLAFVGTAVAADLPHPQPVYPGAGGQDANRQIRVGKTPVGKYPVGKAPAPAPLVTKG
jgi:hypothetical protein